MAEPRGGFGIPAAKSPHANSGLNKCRELRILPLLLKVSETRKPSSRFLKCWREVVS